MDKLGLVATAFVLLGLAAAMAGYEWMRFRAGRPLLKGSQVVVLYWCAYLSAFVLGTTFAVAAVVR